MRRASTGRTDRASRCAPWSTCCCGMFGESLRRQGLRVRCEGFRERRERRCRDVRDVSPRRCGREERSCTRADERLRAATGARGAPGRAGGAQNVSAGEGSARRVQIVPAVDGRQPKRTSQRGAIRRVRGKTAASPHAAALEALGLGEPALSRLCQYLDVLAAWSGRVNLTGGEEQRGSASASWSGMSWRPRVCPATGPADRRRLGQRLAWPRLRAAARRSRGQRFSSRGRNAGRSCARRRGSRDRLDAWLWRGVVTTGIAGAPRGPLPCARWRCLSGPWRRLLRAEGEILVLGGRPRAEPPFTDERLIAGVPGGGMAVSPTRCFTWNTGR